MTNRSKLRSRSALVHLLKLGRRTHNVFCPTGSGGGVDPTCKGSTGKPVMSVAFHGTAVEFGDGIRQTGIRPAMGAAGVAAYTTHAYIEAIEAGIAAVTNRAGRRLQPGDRLAVVHVKPDGAEQVPGSNYGQGENKWSLFRQGVPPEAVLEVRVYDAHALQKFLRGKQDPPDHEDINQFVVNSGRRSYAFLLLTSENKGSWHVELGQLHPTENTSSHAHAPLSQETLRYAGPLDRWLTRNWCNQYGGNTCVGATKRVPQWGPNTTREGVDKSKASQLSKEESHDALSWHDGLTQVGTNKPNPRLPDSTRPDLTPLEAGALQKYSYLNDGPLNARLRGFGKKDSPYGDAFYDEMHGALQSAFGKAKPIQPPKTVVRGMKLSPEALDGFVKKMQGGGEVSFGGYMSTAEPGGLAYKLGLSDGIPTAFKGNVSLKINAVHGLDVGPYSQLPGEGELLLPHGSKFKVKSVTQKKGSWHVELDQLHPEVTANVFCATGAGGGVDPSCGKGTHLARPSAAAVDKQRKNVGDLGAGYKSAKLVLLPVSDLVKTEEGEKLPDHVKGFTDGADVPPLSVGLMKAGGYEVYDGNRRAASAKAAGHTHVWALLTEGWDWHGNRELGQPTVNAAPNKPKNAPADKPDQLPPDWRPDKFVDDGDFFTVDEPLEEVENVFCPTGEGGGVDPTCGKAKHLGTGESVEFTSPQGVGYHIKNLHDEPLPPERVVSMRKTFESMPKILQEAAVAVHYNPKAGTHARPGTAIVIGDKVGDSRGKYLHEAGHNLQTKTDGREWEAIRKSGEFPKGWTDYTRMGSEDFAEAVKLFVLDLVPHHLTDRGKKFADVFPKRAAFLKSLFDPTHNVGNCGIGAGGFQPGNSCAKGGSGGGAKPTGRIAELKSRADAVKSVDGDPPGDGVWGVSPDPFGQDLYNFKTSTGTRYEVMLDAPDRHYKVSGAKATRELSFHDASGSTGVTGAGTAHEVFTHALTASLSAVRLNPDTAITFTAAETSRTKLYDRLTRSALALLPDHEGYEIKRNLGGKRYVLLPKGLGAEAEAYLTKLYPSKKVEKVTANASGVTRIVPEFDPAWLTPEGWEEEATENSKEKQKLTGGRWITTDEGNHVYLKGGKPIAGNPHVIAKMTGTDNPGANEPKPAATRKPTPKVVVHEGHEEKVKQSLSSLFPGKSLEEVGGMLGVPEGSTVSFSTVGSGLVMLVDGPQVSCHRQLFRSGSDLLCSNVSIAVKQKGQGVGTEVFARQVEEMAAAGVKKIMTEAVGGPGEKENGYYTWPRMGYDIPLSRIPNDGGHVDVIKKKFPEAKSLADVMQSPEGRTWWKENGFTLDGMEFDLTPNSRSRKILEAYLEEREKRKPQTSPTGNRRHSTQPWTPSPTSNAGNCGIGSGGFQPGNTCASGGGGHQPDGTVEGDVRHAEHLAPPAPLEQRPENYYHDDPKRPEYKGEVGGLRVREHVPNEDSISATFDDSTSSVLGGVRAVKASLLGDLQKYGAADDNAKVDKLVRQLKKSGSISPLILVADATTRAGGPMRVLEGNHRARALLRMGVTEIPAVVVVDHTEPTQNYNPHQPRDKDGKWLKGASGHMTGGLPPKGGTGTGWPDPAKVKVLQKLGGSTGAQLVQDEYGNKWVMKSTKGKLTEDHLKNEVSADDTYRLFGIKTPPSGLVTGDDGHVYKFGKYLEGQTLAEWEQGKSQASIQGMNAKIGQGFLADALLANHDVVGLGKDNILIHNGEPYRIDNGGALKYRAQGTPKGAVFSNDVGELTSMKDPSVNAQAAGVFGHLTPADLKEQWKTTIAPKLAQLEDTVHDPKILATLKQRVESLKTHLGIPSSTPHTPPTPVPSYAGKQAPDIPGWAHLQTSHKASYGVVLHRTDPLTGETQILLRKPSNNYDGYHWTFPKGKHSEANPLATAEKELAEETGHSFAPTGHLTKTFKGGSGETGFFLGTSTGHDPSKMDTETEKLKWVTLAEAKGLISRTTNPVGRKRDLEILSELETHLPKTGIGPPNHTPAPVPAPTKQDQTKQVIDALESHVKSGLLKPKDVMAAALHLSQAEQTSLFQHYGLDAATSSFADLHQKLVPPVPNPPATPPPAPAGHGLTAKAHKYDLYGSGADLVKYVAGRQGSAAFTQVHLDKMKWMNPNGIQGGSVWIAKTANPQHALDHIQQLQKILPPGIAIKMFDATPKLMSKGAFDPSSVKPMKVPQPKSGVTPKAPPAASPPPPPAPPSVSTLPPAPVAAPTPKPSAAGLFAKSKAGVAGPTVEYLGTKFQQAATLPAVWGKREAVSDGADVKLKQQVSWDKDLHEEWTKTLTYAEKSAIQSWKGNSGSVRKKIFKAARSGDPALAGEGRHILTAMEKHPPQPGVYYRGLHNKYGKHKYADEIARAAEDALASGDGAFLFDSLPHGMSANVKTATYFATQQGGTHVFLRIASRSARPIHKEDGYSGDGWGSDDEKEVLGVPGARYKVLGVHKNVTVNGTKITHFIDLEELPL